MGRTEGSERLCGEG
uniref:Uncharacterized protein n=1 Tax=Anguilla anguilla TaxID=7936 RepID=A0A0E9VGT7_ANGAN